MISKSKTAPQWILAAVAVAAASAALVSCSPTNDKTPAPVVAPVVQSAPPPLISTTPVSERIGLHWIQDQKLRTVMDRVSVENPVWPAGVPQDPESKKVGKPQEFDQVAELAEAMMTSADQLPAVARRLPLNEADTRGFLAEAQGLHDQAERLRDAAHSHHIEQMQLQMAALNSTCISCHSRFRDLSGVLASPQTMIPVDGRVTNR